MQHQEQLRREPGAVFGLVEQILLPHVDFNRFSQLALGKHWRRATAEQQRAFARSFQRMLVRTYAAAFLEYRTWQIKFLPRPEGVKTGSDLVIRSQVLFPGIKPVEVFYRMHHTARGWQIYDVVLEGVSLSTSYRSSFDRIVRQRGLDGLIAHLDKHNRAREEALASK
ncbi:MAG: ABC transporter substrate-binding protein [Chromatiales bacterium]|nr:ABC transporter substrate-binding protein [Chromatiales bacterium]